MENININRDKRLFLCLMLIIVIAISMITFTLFFIIRNSGINLYKIIIKTIILLTIIIIVFLLFLSYLLARLINNKKVPNIFITFLERSVKLIYPVMIFLSSLVNIDKDSIRRVFSQINNKIVILKEPKLNPEDILVIAPHCLQKSFCKHKITGNIDNCHKCGACDISDLIDVCNKYNVKLEIVTGGTLARRLIKDYKPRGIIACVNTRNVEDSIKLFMRRL